MPADSKCGVVVIGRNEGARLQLCFESVQSLGVPFVYVDSNSSDKSVELAAEFTEHIVSLTAESHLSAALARNSGFKKLSDILEGQLDYVQFLDGDCVIDRDWLALAEAHLNQNERVAAVCGWRKEKFPEHSIYNALCDIEWGGAFGEIESCGGDAMYRASAFTEQQGFNTSLIAGEEPELCFRLRQSGWIIWRLDALMTLHDAAISSLSSYLQRIRRGGYATTKGYLRHRNSPGSFRRRQALRIAAWGIGLPAIILALMVFFDWRYALILLVYPLQVLRLSLSGRHGVDLCFTRSFCYSLSLVFGKFAEARGMIDCLLESKENSREIIEYK